MSAGEKVIIRRLHEFAEDDQDLLKFLVENSVVPGVEAAISEVLPFNQTLTLQVSGKTVVLGFTAAQSLYGEMI
jgi:hypothetical protein